MRTITEIHDIRKEFDDEGKSISEISRSSHHSRTTICIKDGNRGTQQNELIPELLKKTKISPLKARVHGEEYPAGYGLTMPAPENERDSSNRWNFSAASTAGVQAVHHGLLYPELNVANRLRMVWSMIPVS